MSRGLFAGENGRMGNVPRPLCPQCGANLRGTTGAACPACGFWIDIARLHHRSALRYWRFLRARRWVDVLVTATWLTAAGVACWLVSFSPGKGFIVLTAIAGAGVVGLGKYLTFRRKQRR